MSQGIRVDYGNKLGKSIIFAKNHRHAEKILEMFNRDYPDYVGWTQVIDNQTRYAQTRSPTRPNCRRSQSPWICWTPASTCRRC